MKNNHTSQTPKILEWRQDFTFLQIFLMRLIEDSCIFICGFAFNLL